MGAPELALSAPAERSGEASSPPVLHDLACVIHLHSTYSDGTASIDEIIEAARATATDVVLLTDHDTLGARDDGHEGWHDDVLLLVGVEVSPRGGHFLAFGVDQTPSKQGGESEIPAAVAALGGFGFAAHPFSAGSRMAERLRLTDRMGRPHGWPAKLRGGLAGIELWSLTTDAAEAWRHPLAAISYMRHPERHLEGPPAHHLELWDELCAVARVAAIGGLDSHQHGFRIRGRMITPMPNQRYFGLLRTHVLCDRPPAHELEPDSAAVLEALREGRCYLGIDAIAPARGFRFWAERPDETALMGEERRAGDWTLRARAPEPAELRLIRNGEAIARSEGVAFEHSVSRAGVYRLEAHREYRGRPRPWIYSNPVYLR